MQPSSHDDAEAARALEVSWSLDAAELSRALQHEHDDAAHARALDASFGLGWVRETLAQEDWEGAREGGGSTHQRGAHERVTAGVLQPPPQCAVQPLGRRVRKE